MKAAIRERYGVASSAPKVTSNPLFSVLTKNLSHASSLSSLPSVSLPISSSSSLAFKADLLKKAAQSPVHSLVNSLDLAKK